MTIIYFIRHGKVENPKNIIYGRLPYFPLSAEGKKQIQKTGTIFFSKSISSIYTSPLLRARQSAKILQKYIGIPEIYTSIHLTEVSSSFEGKPFSFGQENNFDYYFSSKRKEGDETVEDVAKRMMRFITDVSRKHSGQNVIAVSHGDPIMILKRSMEGIPLTLPTIRENEIGYAEVFCVKIDKNRKYSSL